MMLNVVLDGVRTTRPELRSEWVPSALASPGRVIADGP